MLGYQRGVGDEFEVVHWEIGFSGDIPRNEVMVVARIGRIEVRDIQKALEGVSAFGVLGIEGLEVGWRRDLESEGERLLEVY